MRLIQKVGEWFDLRLQLGTPIRETAEHPRPARDRKLVLCFRQRRAHLFHAPACDRHTACADLRAFRGRSVEQPADPQSRRCSGLVHTSAARMGFEFHGRDCPDPYGASLPLRSLQVSQRTDLDRWRPSLTGDAWHGFYRPNFAIRSGCLLGTGHRRIDRKSSSGDRTLGCEPDARRSDHCRRDAFTILRTARFCYPRTTDCFRRRASAHGVETGNQRMAHAGTHRSPRHLPAGISRTHP